MGIFTFFQNKNLDESVELCQAFYLIEYSSLGEFNLLPGHTIFSALFSISKLLNPLNLRFSYKSNSKHRCFKPVQTWVYEMHFQNNHGFRILLGNALLCQRYNSLIIQLEPSTIHFCNAFIPNRLRVFKYVTSTNVSVILL